MERIVVDGLPKTDDEGPEDGEHFFSFRREEFAGPGRRAADLVEPDGDGSCIVGGFDGIIVSASCYGFPFYDGVRTGQTCHVSDRFLGLWWRVFTGDEIEKA